MTQRSAYQLTFEVKPLGSILIGGHSEAPAFADAGTARDGRGRPVLPASAFKGALREALTALVRGQAACDGRDPAAAACTSAEPCPSTTSGEPCVVCRIFGRPGVDRPQHLDRAELPDPGGAAGDDAFTGLGGQLFLEDGALSNDRGDAVLELRHGVSINRYTGARQDGLLFLREVATVRGRTFEVRATAWLSEGDGKLLQHAASLLTEIGNSRSRGLGHVAVTLRLEPLKHARDLPPVQASNTPTAGRFVVRLESPAHFGDAPDASNFQATVSCLPGSTLQGAVAAALLREGLLDLKVAKDKETFDKLMAELSFSDGWPGGKYGAEDLIAPLPRTMLACREHDDQMIDRILAHAVVSELAVRGGGVSSELSCEHTGEHSSACTQALRPTEGCFRLNDRVAAVRVEAPARQVVTRLALDAHTRSFAPGMLYSREQVAAGTVFVGTYSGLSDEVRALLARLKAPLRVGAMRSRGLGRAELRLAPIARNDSSSVEGLRRRVESFQDDARLHAPEALLQSLGWPSDVQWVQVVARTPLALLAGFTPDKASRWLQDELFEGRPVLKSWSFQRTDGRSGWDVRGLRGRKSPTRPVAPLLVAGSTWLFLLEQGELNWKLLHEAEVAGIGAPEQRLTGLGRLTICPRLNRRWSAPQSQGVE